MNTSSPLCPCCSGKQYKDCCQPYHEGKAAPNALALMRSRYSAYAKGLVQYLLKTSHPSYESSPPTSLVEHIRAIRKFCNLTQFKDLEIFFFKTKGKHKATVCFYAQLEQEGSDCSFTEISEFELHNKQWYYCTGEVHPGYHPPKT